VPYDTLVVITKDDPLFTNLDDSLDDLISRGLLHLSIIPKVDPQSHVSQISTYDLHPIVRRFAYDQLTAPERTGVHVLLVVYFQAVPPPPKVQKLEDLAPIIELYHHMVRAGNLDEAMELFRDRCGNTLYFQFGAYQLIVELIRALFLDGEYKPPHLRKESDQSWVLTALGAAYNSSGQPRQAIVIEQLSKEIDEKRGDKLGIAISLGNLGTRQLPIGALSEAENNLSRKIDICREIADEAHEPDGHRDLGRLLSYKGSWDLSERELDLAWNQSDKQRHLQRQSTIAAYQSIRFLLMAREEEIYNTRNPNNQYRTFAIESANRALDLADRTSKTIYPYPRDYVRAYWLLGAAHLANKELTLADENLSKALNLCRQINSVDAEADILLDIARLRYAQGDFKDAQEKAAEALLITERCGYVLQGADVNLFLAQYALEQEKDNAKSKGYAEEALKLATCDGPPYYYKVAYEEAERFLENL
jgi:tetratricopeptide (TPR) repeat protein